jgi:hypothetical protein
VQRDPDAQRSWQRPGFGLERPLERGGGSDGVGCAGEDGEEAVAFAPAFDDPAVGLSDGGCHEGVVAGQRRAHRRGVLLPEAGAAFDVGEEEGDGPRREIEHAPPLPVAGARG